jgi:hypothetical protein
MTTAGLRGYLDTQKSEFLREVRLVAAAARCSARLRAFPPRISLADRCAALGPDWAIVLGLGSCGPTTADYGQGGAGV